MCQGSSHNCTTQNTDTSSNNFTVGFNNTALSEETENGPGYQSLQIQRNDYEQLRHYIGQRADESGSIHEGYIDVTEYPLPRSTHTAEDESIYTLPQNPDEGYVGITDYNSV